jgi:hypothetical protein
VLLRRQRLKLSNLRFGSLMLLDDLTLSNDTSVSFAASHHVMVKAGFNISPRENEASQPCGGVRGAEKFRSVGSRLWQKMWKIQCTNHSMHGFGDANGIRSFRENRLAEFLVTETDSMSVVAVLYR